MPLPNRRNTLGFLTLGIGRVASTTEGSGTARGCSVVEGEEGIMMETDFRQLIFMNVTMAALAKQQLSSIWTFIRCQDLTSVNCNVLMVDRGFQQLAPTKRAVDNATCPSTHFPFRKSPFLP